MISEIFIFESADSVKSGEQAGTFAVEYLYSTLLLDSPIQTLPKKVVESHVSQQAVLHMADICCFNPLNTITRFLILDPIRVQTVELMSRPKNHEKCPQNRFL